MVTPKHRISDAPELSARYVVVALVSDPEYRSSPTASPEAGHSASEDTAVTCNCSGRSASSVADSSRYCIASVPVLSTCSGCCT